MLAYRPTDNSLLVIECKSYLDSPGVDPRHFDPKHKSSSRYKLFTDERLWPVVSRALLRKLVDAKLVNGSPSVKLGLAYGRAVQPEVLRQLFAEQNWLLIEPRQIVRMLGNLAKDGWENSTTSIVTKLLLAQSRDKKGLKLSNASSGLGESGVGVDQDSEF